MNELPEIILAKAREKKGWTQQQMADKLAAALKQGYSMRQYQKLEDGEFPKLKTAIMKEIDKILGTKLYEVIYEQNIPRETAASNDHHNRLIELEARARVYETTLIDLLSGGQKKASALVASELKQAILNEREMLKKEYGD